MKFHMQISHDDRYKKDAEITITQLFKKIEVGSFENS